MPTPTRYRVAAFALTVAACALLPAFAAAGVDLTYSPMPPYPAFAAAHHWAGQGGFLITFGADGKANRAQIVYSTGHPSLDALAIETLKTWRCRPGIACRWRVAIPFWPPTSSDVRSAEKYKRTTRPMIRAPHPDYPEEARERALVGVGLFQLNFKPDGTVATLTVRRSTGYPVLDKAVEGALVRWVAKPGYHSVIVPINFGLPY